MIAQLYEINNMTDNIDDLDLYVYMNLQHETYTDANKLMTTMMSMRNDADTALKTFIELMTDFANYLVTITQDTKLKIANDMLNKAIRENTNNIINTFIEHAHANSGELRRAILIRNDAIFIDKSADSTIELINLCQQYWTILDANAKHQIFTYMIALVYYSDIYHITYERYKLIRHLNINMFPKVFNNFDYLYI